MYFIPGPDAIYINNAVNSVNRLPIDDIADEVCESLRQSNVVLQAEPGAGKSTGLPLSLLKSGFDGKILMLEPRRIAAQNVASRLAAQLDEPLGQRIGLRMRGRTVASKTTRLEVVTEGVLTRILQNNPLLDGISVVIFDEFHERSLHADLGLALCLDVQREVREDLRLLLMSATLDGDGLCNHLGLKEPLTCSVRQYPVEIIWRNIGRSSLLQVASQTVLEATQQHPGDTLVFLPGVSEIEEVARILRGRLADNIALHRLHRGVDAMAQAAATSANKDSVNHRRVILSTSIAETSITIDGVGIVIDSGIERRARLDTSSGIERLESVMSSKASAVQRAGRAGRTSAGVCYRLWSEESHASRAASWQAEILRAELSALLLEAGQWGASDIYNLPWIDAPPSGAVVQARSLLVQLGIWSNDGLTSHGRLVAKLPVDPRVGHMLLWGATRGFLQQATALAALLEDMPAQSGADFSLVSDRLSSSQKRKQKQLITLLQQTIDINDTAAEQIDTGVLLAQVYPDRIAKRRTTRPDDSDIRYQLSGGAGAVLREEDPVTQHEYIVVVSLGGHVTAGGRDARIFSAHALDIKELQFWCENRFEMHELVQWDEKLERVIAERQHRVGALVVDRQVNTDISDEQCSEALIQGLRKAGIDSLNWSEESREWQARVERLRAVEGHDTDLPAVDDKTLLAELETWLLPYVSNINSLKKLKQLSLMPVLKALLTYPQQQRLDSLLPIKYKVPSGASHKLCYTNEGNPVLSVKLQEMFGCRENPSVADGRIPLKVELLSPARRPVQITEDLGNFWHNSYPDVKKDLAGRYPKHPWPDNPLDAKATAYTKSARTNRG